MCVGSVLVNAPVTATGSESANSGMRVRAVAMVPPRRSALLTPSSTPAEILVKESSSTLPAAGPASGADLKLLDGSLSPGSARRFWSRRMVGLGVPAVDERSDLRVEVLDRLDDAAADGLTLDDPEPRFDEVHPRGVGRGEVHDDPRMRGQPRRDGCVHIRASARTPRAGAGTRMSSRTSPSIAPSLRCPPVITITNGRPCPSTAAWIFVISPPRDRPIP
jgi:hypothetical protein